MSTQGQQHPPHEFDDSHLLDCLVDGELADAERRALLLRLEEEPDGWRRCALAFLEAQSWRETLGPLAVRQCAAAVVPAPPSRHSPAWWAAARFATLAAGLAAAFVLGWAVHDRHAEELLRAPAIVVEAPVPATDADVPRAASPEQRAEATPLSRGAHESDALLAPVVKQWEQRGYRADLQQRQVSMELKDGRKLALPVHEVRLRYVGDRTY